MKRLFAATVFAVLCPTTVFADEPKSDQPAEKKQPATRKQPDIKIEPNSVEMPFKTDKENLGYAIGLNFAKNLVQSLDDVEFDRKKVLPSFKLKASFFKSLGESGLEVEEKRVREGFQDALNDAKPKLADEQIALVFRKAQETMRAKQMKEMAEQQRKAQEEQKAAAEKNKKAGEEFLAKNKKREAVKTTESGLQYEVLEKGTGEKPKPTDTVTVNYRGTLIDGKEFDSSKRHGGPQPITINRVIKGWQEALPMMPVGSKWKLFIPAKLAYEDRPAGPDIGPNSTLVFEIELLGIKEAPKPKKAPKKP